jgi:hypothetical protein
MTYDLGALFSRHLCAYLYCFKGKVNSGKRDILHLLKPFMRSCQGGIRWQMLSRTWPWFPGPGTDFHAVCCLSKVPRLGVQSVNSIFGYSFAVVGGRALRFSGEAGIRRVLSIGTSLVLLRHVGVLWGWKWLFLRCERVFFLSICGCISASIGCRVKRQVVEAGIRRVLSNESVCVRFRF